MESLNDMKETGFSTGGAQPSSSMTYEPTTRDAEKGPAPEFPTVATGESEETVVEEEIDESDKHRAFPEGGLTAWLCVFGGFAMTFITFGYINSFGIWESYYLTTLPGKTSGDIAWVGGLNYCLILAPSAVAGRLLDMGHYRKVYLLGSVILVAGQMGLSWCKSYATILVCQGIIVGIGFGLVFTIGVTCPTHHFLRRRGLALGIVASGSSCGGVIFPIAIKNLIPLIGEAWTIRAVGFLQICALIIGFLVLKTRLPPKAQGSNQDLWKVSSWVDLHALHRKDYAFFCAGAALMMFGMYTPFTFIDTLTSTYNIPGDGYYVSVLNSASLFGRIIPGMLADRYGRITTLLPFMCIATILLICFPFCTNTPGIVIFSLIFGFSSGCFVSLVPACSAQLGSTETVGQRNGTTFMFQSIGGLVGTPIAGIILGSLPHYHWLATGAYSFAICCAGAVCVFLGWWFSAENRFKKKSEGKA